MPPLSSSLHERVGEAIGLLQGVVQRLDDIETRIRDRSEESRRQQETLSSEIRTVKHDQRGHEQIIAGQLDLMRGDVRRTGERLTAVGSNVEAMQKTVGLMQAPLDELVRLRNRGAAILAAVVLLISIVWLLASPIYTIFVTKLFGAGQH